MSWKKIFCGALAASMIFSASTFCSAAPESANAKLAKIETDTYGSEQSGAILDRISRLEKSYSGQNMNGNMNARIDAIYDILYNNDVEPGVLAKINALEWNFNHEVESGGVDTLVELDCTVETGGGVAQVTILDAAAVVDNKISVSYKKADATLVTAADIIGGIDAATGAATGLALVDSIYPKWNLIPGILIAPKFSTDVAVITALTRKAKSISDVFSGVAICDIPTSCKTYSQAVEWKNENNLSDSHLILTYPKVLAEGKQYHLSTHLAALMNRVDYSNDSVPYQSPSNQGLEISAAVLDDGTEVFFNQSTANFMNANGIVTVFTFGNSLRAWGNYTSAYPATNDVKDIFIPVRRMFDFLSAMLLTNYISNLDVPIVRRQVDSILQSCNLYLASLTSRQMLLGGDLTFNEADNSTSDLMAGKITFRLNYCPPVPAQNIQFILEYDSSYYANLFQ